MKKKTVEELKAIAKDLCKKVVTNDLRSAIRTPGRLAFGG